MEDIGFGARVHMRRKLLGLSQKDLADRVGISQPAIKKIEAGGQTRKGRAVADALGTTLQWLEVGADSAVDSDGNLHGVTAHKGCAVSSSAAQRQNDADWLPASIDRDKVRQLSATQKAKLEGAILHAADVVGLDIKKP